MSRSLLEQHRHPKYPRLTVQLRARSRFYQALTFLDGRKHQKSLKTPALDTAFRLAEIWYKKLLRSSVTAAKRHPVDRLATDPTIGEVFNAFRLTLTASERSYVDTKWGAISPFWRTIVVTEVTPKLCRDFYTYRRKHKTQYGEPPANTTLHKDITLVRQILHHAVEEGHLPHLPPLIRPGRIKKNPRPWLDPAEWEHLIAVSEKRTTDAADQRLVRITDQRLDLHEFMQFMVATCCRVGEVLNLRYRDCTIDRDGRRRPIALHADVTGKRGTRAIVAPPAAAKIIAVRQARLSTPDPSALVFPTHHRDAFRELLIAANLRTNAQGFSRNLKTLRYTAISFRVLESQTPNLLSIARNAGTSLQQLDDFYCKRLTPGMFKAELSTTPTAAGDTLD